MASKPTTPKKAAGTAKKAAGAAVKAAEPKIIKKTLTQEDLDLNPQLLADGYKVGDEVEVEDENAGDEGVNAAATANKVTAPKKNAVSVDIIKNGSEYIRTYSAEVHGEDFHDLADEYLEGHPNTEIADSDKINIVIVNYRVTDKKSGVSTDTQKSFSGKDGEDFKEQALAFKNEVNGTVTIR